MSANELPHTMSDYLGAAIEYFCTVLNSSFAIAFIGALAGAYAGAVAANRSIVKTQERNELLKEIRSVNAAIIVSLSICNTLLGLKAQIIQPLFDRFSKDRDAFRSALDAIRNGQLRNAPFQVQMQFTAFAVPILPIDALKELIYQRISAHGKPLSLVGQIEAAAAGLLDAVDRREQIAESFKRSPPKDTELPFVYFGETLASGQTHREYADILEVIRSHTNDIIWFSSHLCEELVRYGRSRESQFAQRFGKGSPGINEPDFKEPRQNGLVPADKEYSSWLKWISERNLEEPSAETGSIDAPGSRAPRSLFAKTMNPFSQLTGARFRKIEPRRRQQMKEFLNAFFGIAVGAMITWFVSWHYYVAAGKELSAETERLRALQKTTLLALQNLQNKNVTFQLSPDEKGDLTRMGVEIRAGGAEATSSDGQGSPPATETK